MTFKPVIRMCVFRRYVIYCPRVPYSENCEQVLESAVPQVHKQIFTNVCGGVGGWWQGVREVSPRLQDKIEVRVILHCTCCDVVGLWPQLQFFTIQTTAKLVNNLLIPTSEVIFCVVNFFKNKHTKPLSWSWKENLDCSYKNQSEYRIHYSVG